MTWLSAHILVVCISIAMALSSLVILGQRRSPQATIAWLLFLVMLPYFALPVFLLLGFRKRPDAPALFRDATRLGQTALSTSRVRAF
ncbi:MAG: PLDc N-terminal domain-containing protein, partial [Oricola sp.]|nr:PLDc N-terminal domain-containing protein [Oricola sp.]